MRAERRGPAPVSIAPPRLEPPSMPSPDPSPQPRGSREKHARFHVLLAHSGRNFFAVHQAAKSAGKPRSGVAFDIGYRLDDLVCSGIVKNRRKLTVSEGFIM